MTTAGQDIDGAAPVPTGPLRTRQLLLTTVVVLLALWMALAFMTPIIWAVVLAVAEWPLFRRVLKRFPNRAGWIALGFTLATALLVIVPLSMAAVSLGQESQGALDWLKHVQQSGLPAPGWLGSLPLMGAKASEWWQQHLATPQGANALLGTLSATSILDWMRSIGGEVAKDSALFLVTLLVLVTLLAHGEHISGHSKVVAKRSFAEFGEQFLVKMTEAVRATVNGTVLVSVVEGGIIGVGYAVAGVPQPLLFATFTIVLALIPFGAWVVFGLASLILITMGSVLAGVLLLVFGIVVMTIGDNFVQPTVIGSAVELPFALAMIGAFGGLAQLGLVGLFVGPVIMAAFLLVWRYWLGSDAKEPAPRRGRRGLRRHRPKTT